MSLILEIVEGPGAGRQLELTAPIVIGRAPEADFTIDDERVSRRHAQLTPAGDGSAVIEDLGSANGIFVNHNEVQGTASVGPGDELVMGVTVLGVRRSGGGATTVRTVPPALATAPRAPTYVKPAPPADERIPQLERYLDARVRRRAQLAPVALFALVAIVLFVYFATR